jgi:SNF2 family DNA or RNA helicase
MPGLSRIPLVLNLRLLLMRGFDCFSFKTGSVADFKRYFATPIMQSNDGDASSAVKALSAQAQQRLRTWMGKIMLRRTQADILCKLLPPRTDYVVYCGCSANQEAEYNIAAGEITR